MVLVVLTDNDGKTKGIVFFHIKIMEDSKDNLKRQNDLALKKKKILAKRVFLIFVRNAIHIYMTQNLFTKV